MEIPMEWTRVYARKFLERTVKALKTSCVRAESFFGSLFVPTYIFEL
jgi:hypothetical protein